MRPSSELVLDEVVTTSDVRSAAIDVSNVAWASVIAKITTAGTGSIIIEVSNDPINQTPTTWVALGTAGTVATSGAGTYIIPKVEICHNFLRVFYDATSGTGTLSARLNTQGY